MRGRLLVAAALLALALPGAAEAAGSDRGPFGTQQRAYDLGRANLLVEANGVRLHALPTRLAGEITVPVGAPGRRPVVVILHGAHQSCEVPDLGLPTQDWPCLPGFADVPSFEGYRYLARLLASHGFVVVSLDGNPVAPADSGALSFPDGTRFTPRTWMDLRSKIVDAQLARLARANSGATGAGTDFALDLGNRLDLKRVGLVGHSRGGEGVVWASLLAGPRPYRVRAIVALAPVDFYRRLIPDVPFAVVLPYCDADVFDLEGAWFYDDARSRRRSSPLWQVVVDGGNHNFFNRVWADETGFMLFRAGRRAGGEPAGFVDPCSPDQIGTTRLSREAQEAFGSAVIVPFLRGYVATAPAALVRSLVAPLGIGGALPDRIAGAAVRISYQPPSAQRLDVLRPRADRDLGRNLLGGRVVTSGFQQVRLCAIDPGRIRGGARVRCGSRPPFLAHALTTYRLAWGATGARLAASLPGGRDVAGFDAVSVRVALDPSDARRNPTGASRPFTVVLRDTAGGVAAVTVPRSHPAVQPTRRGLGVLATVRLELSAFGEVDLSSLESVELVFDRTSKGRLLVTDLSFVRD